MDTDTEKAIESIESEAPDNQILVSVDAQELNSMDLCPERWNLEHVQHWRPRTKPKAMERGIIMHAMLGHYYKSKIDQYDKTGQLYRKARTRPDEQASIISECIKIGRIMSATTPIPPEEFENLDLRVFKEYILHWQYDGWEVLSVEAPFTVVLYESPKLKILYQGITDLIVNTPKEGKLVVDTKTESRKSNPYMLSNQFQGYNFASGFPVVINKVGYQQEASLPVEQRFRRIYLEYSDDIRREWVTDTIKQVITSIGWMQDLDKGRRLRKNRTSCDKYAGCSFQKVCKEPPDVRDQILFVNFMKKQWDPYNRDGEDALTQEQSLASIAVSEE